MNLYKIFAVLFIAISAACVDNNDFDTPTLGEDKTYTNLESLSDIVAKYDSSLLDFNELLTDDNSGDVEELNTFGYVVSDDRAGNFYKILTIQDAPENPTIAVKVLIDATNLNAYYNVGRKVYIRLNGLALNKNFESWEIGLNGGSRIDRIEETDFLDFVERSSEIADIVPTVLTIDELNDNHINTMVKIEGMQSEDKGATFANVNDTFSVNRNLVNCETEKTIIMRTSGFSNFKGLAIPAKKGSVTAILGKFRDDFQLYVNNPEALDFTEDRCDPVPLECGAAAGQGANTIFEEDFEAISNDFAGWTNVNVNGGSEVYELRSFSGNKYAQISAYRSGENPLESWLVSPAINLDGSTDEVVSFKTKDAFNNGAALSVFVSTDFAGDPKTATWFLLDEASLATGTSSGYAADFTDSGVVSLSCLSGDVYIGFKYRGGDGNVTTTFQVDDVKVTGN